ncbi:glutamyl-tRNA amidotransferase [Eubacterium callanderi]|uniref:glutamyl-tRNA amidotransferase n=1 Tax=Eubacterium callanderi TaxID=53442 RepID=UPI003AF09FCF
MNAKMRHCFSVYMAMVLCVLCATTVCAADDPIAVVTNLSNFIFGLVRAIGMILIGYGIVQIGLSLKSHDPSQRANGIMTVAGGIVVTFAKEILNTIAG